MLYLSSQKYRENSYIFTKRSKISNILTEPKFDEHVRVDVTVGCLLVSCTEITHLS